MLRNPFKVLQDLVARPGAEIGVVLSSASGQVVIELPGGGEVTARGSAAVGTTVYFRDGLVESTAPSLPIVTIEI